MTFMSVYACADLHGRLDLFNQIQNSLQPDDTLYVIGDVFDRGPDGWKLFKEVMKDHRCKMLMGNHERMAWEALRNPDPQYEDFELWYYNGGYTTHDQMLEDENFRDIIPLLRDLPLETKYINKDNIQIILNHSGFYGKENNLYLWRQDILWDREQYKIDFVKGWRGPADTIIIHGHTPISSQYRDLKQIALLYDLELPPKEEGAFWYAKDKDDNCHKVNIDAGAVWSGKAIVLDLDTFDEHIFVV